MVGIILHHACHFVQFPFLERTPGGILRISQSNAIVEYVAETDDDIQRCAYLVRQVLDKQVLPLNRLFGQFHIAGMLLITLLEGFSRLTDAPHVVAQLLLHGG